MRENECLRERYEQKLTKTPKDNEGKGTEVLPEKKDVTERQM